MQKLFCHLWKIFWKLYINIIFTDIYQHNTVDTTLWIWQGSICIKLLCCQPKNKFLNLASNYISDCCSYHLWATGVRVVHLQNASKRLMRPTRETNYITQKPCRSATNWLPPLWECFPFKQTRSCRRWRRVCKGVKETAVLNESVETGEFPALCLLLWHNAV